MAMAASLATLAIRTLVGDDVAQLHPTHPCHFRA
jgi:hypothetical protein